VFLDGPDVAQGSVAGQAIQTTQAKTEEIMRIIIEINEDAAAFRHDYDGSINPQAVGETIVKVAHRVLTSLRHAGHADSHGYVFDVNGNKSTMWIMEG
jgi:hypothetical protein